MQINRLMRGHTFLKPTFLVQKVCMASQDRFHFMYVYTHTYHVDKIHSTIRYN